MNALDEFRNLLYKLLYVNKTDFVQYHHIGTCSNPCMDCFNKDKRIFENNNQKPPVGLANHPHCHCFYTNVPTKRAGEISNKGILAPDVYLKTYGHLPAYYITKEEATELGWSPGKNLSHFAPGKMIGGDIYNNKKHILPEKEGRIWYECDVDYTELKRNSLRLYYSNDGLMFYSPDHLENEFQIYYVK